MFRLLKQTHLSLVLLAVALLLIFFHWVGVLRPVEDVIINIFSPIQSRVYALGVNINGLYSNITGKNELVKDNLSLQQEIQDLLTENASLKIRVEELVALLEQQDFLQRNSLEYVSARVIGQNPEANLQAIVLDRGSADGVQLNYPVIVGNGVMVGKISKVNKYSSEAILVNDSQSKISAIILNETQTQGVVVGEHGLNMTMELIPQNEVVNEGEAVVTAGIEPTIARGLMIGQVSRIESESGDLFQTIRVRSLVKIDKLVTVSIIKPNISE